VQFRRPTHPGSEAVKSRCSIKLQIPDHGKGTVQVCGVLAGEGTEVHSCCNLLSCANIQRALHQLRSTSHMTPAAIIFLHSLSSRARLSSAIVIM
jgi:hypothetical protein